MDIGFGCWICFVVYVKVIGVNRDGDCGIFKVKDYFISLWGLVEDKKLRRMKGIEIVAELVKEGIL